MKNDNYSAMELNILKEKISRIDKIVSRWSCTGDVSPIEHDLVLGKIKELYEQVLFMDGECSCSNGDDCSCGSDCHCTEDQRDKCMSLPIDDQPMVKRVDRQTILSLYCDEPVAPVDNIREESQPKEVVPIAEPIVEVKVDNSQQTMVLGDLLGSNIHTVGEAIGATNVIDVATRVAGEKRESLSKMIGINDRFLMINDLFGGDASVYQLVIEKLDKYNDLDDAMIYIHDTYNWNPNNEGLKLLVELLSRKLS